MKKYNGEFTGKLAPYGYIKDPKDKHKFLIDKNVSHIIKKIFDMILDGKSRRQVADFLNDNDILTPSEYLNINTNEGISMVKKWNPEMVNTILKNENYTGTLFQGKRRKLNYRVNKQIRLDKENWIITPNHHEAIISKEKFDKVQDILNNYVTRTNRKGNLDTLSGFLKCGDCKGQMHLKKGKNKSYYYCTNYFNKKCTSHSIEKTKLEEMILEKLKLNKITRSYLYESVKTIYINDDKTISIDYK